MSEKSAAPPRRPPVRVLIASLIVVLALVASAYGLVRIYNAIQGADEQVTAHWAHVVNQYQRRADLVPNLVSVVKAYAEHERAVLTEIAEARASLGGFHATGELLQDPKIFAQYQMAQVRMGGALARLLAVAENYPQLKADGVFRDLQAQLEGTENRVTYARSKYIHSVMRYNTMIRTFPSNLLAGYFDYSTKPSFQVENERAIATAPEVVLR